MPRYVIHIGPMKTGSTYLQQCFAAVAKDLLAQGVCYPSELLSENNEYNHTRVYAGCRKRWAPDLQRIFAGLNESGHDTILISAEQLSFLTQPQLTLLRDVIGVSDIDVVYVCRRWSDRIPSTWFQSLYRGDAHTLPEYYVKFLNGLDERENVDYSRSWDMLASVFGREHLHIFPYSTIRDQGEDIFEKFCTDILKLGKVPKPPRLGAELWASFGKEETELLRALNDMHIAQHGVRDVMVYWKYKRARKRSDFSRVTEAMGPFMTTMTLDDEATHLEPFFARMSNFADRVVGGGASVSPQGKGAVLRRAWVPAAGRGCRAIAASL
jgi:hypothetical protein